MGVDIELTHHEPDKKKDNFFKRVGRGYSNLKKYRRAQWYEDQAETIKKEKVKADVAEAKYKTHKYKRHVPSAWDSFSRAVVGTGSAGKSYFGSSEPSTPRPRGLKRKKKSGYSRPSQTRAQHTDSYEGYDRSLGNINRRLKDLL